MEIRDAIKIKEKLSEVLETVDEFGRQAEQFSKAKKGLNDLIDVLLNSNNLIGDLITESQKYLDGAKSIIDGECFAKICEQNNLAKQIAEDLKTNSETSNSQLKETADDFIAHAQSLEEKCKELQSCINSVYEIKNEIESIVVENSTKVSSNIEKTNNKIDEFIEASSKNQESLCDMFKSSEGTITSKIDNVNTELKDCIKNIEDKESKTQDIIADNHKKVTPLLEEQNKKLQQLIQAVDEKETKTQNVIIENGEKISPLLAEYNEKLTLLKQFILEEDEKAVENLKIKIDELWKNQQGIINQTNNCIEKNQELKNVIAEQTEYFRIIVKKISIIGGLAASIIVIMQIIGWFVF